jgi:histidinol-phosphatase (PHP family)
MEAFMHNLRGLTFTCHAPMQIEYSANIRMGWEEYDQYLAEISATRAAWHGLLDLRRGLEADYAPGLEEFLPGLLVQAPLDIVLGSVHPQFPEYWERYFEGDPVAFQRTYFVHLAQAAESGFFDALTHADLVRELFPDTWDYQQLRPEILRSLDRIARTGVAMEVNTSSLRRHFAEPSPGPEMLREMAARGIPIILSSDAHAPGRVGDRFAHMLDLLAELGFQRISHFLGRKRCDQTIADARRSLIH